MSVPVDGANVRELIVGSTSKVVEAAQFVRINAGKVTEFAQSFALNRRQTPMWDHNRHFCDHSQRTAQWIFVLDALNFSFWADRGDERWTVEWNGETVKGYWALAVSLKLAMEKGLPIADASYLEQISIEELQALLGGSGKVPMIEERVKVLNEIGGVLRSRYDGSFANLIEESGQSVSNLVRLVVSNFPCFNDVASYRGRPVYFYKRAQILVSDLWGAFGGKGLGALGDMERLTAFADYKLPQVLRAVGVLEYAFDLAQKVDSLSLLAPGSIEEIEIRSATICAVEDLGRNLASLGVELPSYAIDWCLWGVSHDVDYERLPHHRTRTIYY